MPESPCSIHRVGGGLLRSPSEDKDVGAYYDFPPPPTISYQFDEHFSREYLRNFPRDVTTNTVSTTADVVNCDDFDVDVDEQRHFDDYTSRDHHQELVQFDLEQPLSVRAPSIVLPKTNL
ncbi:unnamed protein product [Brassicogethes aeneus]|uniref:Uncharacterized protein n=1 Tax=Brassicogethes aeneus TaxID=1431903 RepID=A0A9P0BHB5_BRAAE|nr:unnamed protein product [Brassicogethes aeneus]